MNKVLSLLRKVPKGKVTTYKNLADAAGTHPRTVAMIMKRNKDPVKYPCYMVVCSDGSIGGYSAKGGASAKIKKLRKDGIVIKSNKIQNLENVSFTFS